MITKCEKCGCSFNNQTIDHCPMCQRPKKEVDKEVQALASMRQLREVQSANNYTVYHRAKKAK